MPRVNELEGGWSGNDGQYGDILRSVGLGHTYLYICSFVNQTVGSLAVSETRPTIIEAQISLVLFLWSLCPQAERE